MCKENEHVLTPVSFSLSKYAFGGSIQSWLNKCWKIIGFLQLVINNVQLIVLQICKWT